MSISQTFINETDQLIEAIYMFPLETELKNTAVTNVKFKKLVTEKCQVKLH